MDLGLKDWAISGLIVALLGGGFWNDYQKGVFADEIVDLKEKVDNTNKKLGACKTSKVILKSSVKKLNKVIEEQRINIIEIEKRWNDRTLPEDYLDKWKLDNNLTSKGEDCENAYLIFDAISKHGY